MYLIYDPPITVTVRHCMSGAAKDLQAHAKNTSSYLVNWPLCGVHKFRAKDGAGIGEVRSWALTTESLAALKAATAKRVEEERT